MKIPKGIKWAKRDTLFPYFEIVSARTLLPPNYRKELRDNFQQVLICDNVSLPWTCHRSIAPTALQGRLNKEHYAADRIWST